MNWYAYEIPPIDIGWDNLKTVKETISSLTTESDLNEPNYLGSFDLQYFLSTWESAQVAAKTVGWEGDFRHDPVVMWIPNDTEFSYGFVFKQDNNGTTFVISPVPMPWLDQL